jgi:uncharacterized protein (TIGR04255 family)
MSKKLKDAPLKEAIFELFWQSPLDNTGFPIDRGFDLAQGKFAIHIADRFPYHKRILPQNSAIKVYGQPIHQFWKGNVEWPVVQLGQGILTVNDTDKNYEWNDTYRPNIHKALDILLLSYSEPLNFNKISLKYIDSVDIDYDTDLSKFISVNLQTALVNNYKPPGKLIGLNLNQVFAVDGSDVHLNIQTATNNLNAKQAIVWITTVIKVGTLSKTDILTWIDQAHSITSNLFVEMLNPQFYASFNK